VRQVDAACRSWEHDRALSQPTPPTLAISPHLIAQAAAAAEADRAAHPRAVVQTGDAPLAFDLSGGRAWLACPTCGESHTHILRQGRRRCRLGVVLVVRGECDHSWDLSIVEDKGRVTFSQTAHEACGGVL